MLNTKQKVKLRSLAMTLRPIFQVGKEGISKNSNWEAENPDWNKIILIPVSTTKDSNGEIVKINHDISISSVRLRGGTEYKIPLYTITSTFND